MAAAECEGLGTEYPKDSHDDYPIMNDEQRRTDSQETSNAPFECLL